ncbi:PREDICTED: neuropeptide Y receptor-like [Priapulus caudatus]|uniref:Neuropeptide Y receptor-like n=1 Tax=Priapulus caudatus TaxID=37621 RepID=A0ABM1F119_PRICU|nr:PREDICTED: neuropeptide Y receptor-like [Priapulus caudatus]
MATTAAFPANATATNVSSAPYPFADDDQAIPPAMQAVMVLMYTAICVLASGGNAIVCYIVIGYQRMRTTTNYFIVNLAVGDILMALLCIPFDFVANQLLDYWPFGDALCPVVGYVQAVSVFLSAYTMVAISLDRFHAIVYPLRPRLTGGQAKAIIGIVWLVSLAVPVPIAVTSTVVTYVRRDGARGDHCEEDWLPPKAQNAYSWSLMTLQYLAPLLALSVTYSVICYHLWGKRPPGEAEDSRDQRLERSKRKVIKMMIAVVVMFALLWLPLNTFMVFADMVAGWAYVRHLWFVFHWLAMSHACVNPFIYSYMNSKFRNGFRHVFRFLPCCRLPATPGSIEMYENGGSTVRHTSVSLYPQTNKPRVTAARPVGRECSSCLARSSNSLATDWRKKGAPPLPHVCNHCASASATTHLLKEQPDARGRHALLSAV